MQGIAGKDRRRLAEGAVEEEQKQREVAERRRQMRVDRAVWRAVDVPGADGLRAAPDHRLLWWFRCDDGGYDARLLPAVDWFDAVVAAGDAGIVPVWPWLVAPTWSMEAEADQHVPYLGQLRGRPSDGSVRWLDEAPHMPEGSARRTRLYRRSFVAGWGDGEEPVAYSEQVLKVGWPFTTVRGFVRRAGADVSYEGAVPLSEPARRDSGIKILPLQIVWPGLVIDSGLIAALLGVLSTIVSSRRAADSRSPAD